MACEVESAYIQPTDTRPDPTIQVAQGIPVIDLSPLDSGDKSQVNQLVEEVKAALKEWRMFFVVNHGIPADIRQNADGKIAQFFALPLEEKLKVQRDFKDTLGYFNKELTHNTKDWVEVYDYFVNSPVELPANAEADCPKMVTLANKRPENPLGFVEACDAYGKEAERLGFRLLEVIALSLGLPSKRFQAYFENSGSFNRVNHYPPCPSPSLVLGKGCHTDASALTVLATDNVSGLEIKRKDGKWLKVNPLPGAYIINTGEAMNVFSNGYYESLEHRVVANTNQHRYSMGFSFGPASHVMVKPLKELVNELNPPKFKGFMWGKFYRSRRNSNFLRLNAENLEARHFKINQ
ncbi:hypothetical protein AMTRI_Chr02g256920 [Amborella trichopoda]